MYPRDGARLSGAYRLADLSLVQKGMWPRESAWPGEPKLCRTDRTARTHNSPTAPMSDRDTSSEMTFALSMSSLSLSQKNAEKE